MPVIDVHTHMLNKHWLERGDALPTALRDAVRGAKAERIFRA